MSWFFLDVETLRLELLERSWVEWLLPGQDFFAVEHGVEVGFASDGICSLILHSGIPIVI